MAMAPVPVRDDPQLVADERTTLTSWLDFHRTTLRQKCEGLTGPQMVRASVPPSAMTLLGLVQHMTSVEWWWFEHIFAAGPAPEPIETGDDTDAEWHMLEPGRVATALQEFQRQCAHSRAIVGRAASFDALSASAERPTRDLRWVMAHMIEEYARHNGHADLLRECIDGAVGD
jgi:hypothetical protein